MLSAHDVARYFLTLQDEDDRDITNLKLQKLLYYAQGFFLAAFREPLFDERLYAWQHGPVVPSVWREYKDNGSTPIPAPDGFEVEAFDDRVREHLDEVWRLFGQFSAWKLRNMTHDEPPWKKHEAAQDEITHDDLVEYFRTQLE